jgi:hypothetical protein
MQAIFSVPFFILKATFFGAYSDYKHTTSLGGMVQRSLGMNHEMADTYMVKVLSSAGSWWYRW